MPSASEDLIFAFRLSAAFAPYNICPLCPDAPRPRTESGQTTDADTEPFPPV